MTPRRVGLLLPFLVVLGYTGSAWLAAVPVSAACVRLAQVPRLVVCLRRLRLLLLLLGLLLASALLSALVHPSGQAAPLVESLAACCSLAVILALGPQSELTRWCLQVGAVVVVLVMALTALSDPTLLAAKMPSGAGRALARLGGGVGPGRGVLHPNGTAAVAAMVAAGWFAAAVAPGTTPRRCVRLGVAVFLSGLVAASGSRGGLMALGAGVLAALTGRRHPPLMGVVAAVCLAGLAALALAALATQGPRDREPLQQGSPASAHAGLVDLGWRTAAWEGTAAAIAESPWLGRGIGSFPLAYSPVQAAEQPVNSHNTFLQVWLDLGLGGLVAVAGLIAQTLVITGWRAASSPAQLVLGAACVASLISSMVECVVLVTVAAPQPWLGTVELASPHDFVLWGLAAAVGDSGEVRWR
ncbi:MAG TPA: O-antigen ligase family protein [Candidatus Dormibacteraeota bacterium]